MAAGSQRGPNGGALSTTNTFTLSARLPTMLAPFGKLVETGGLMCYGPNYTSMFRRAAEYVDKILRGAKPADMPFEQPTKFDLIINLATAKAIGLNIPESFLLRADEVIVWHEPNLQRCPPFGRYRGKTRHGADCPIRSRMTLG
jgi:hypothetical protein